MSLGTMIMWMVAVGVGIAVVAVVIVLLQLLLSSVKALDRRVDYVLTAAVGVIENTAAAVPQLQAAQKNVAALSAGADQRPPAQASARTWRS